MRVRFAERRGARPTQVDQVRADAERIADVRAQGANVGAGFAPHPEEDVPTINLERLKLVDMPGSLLPLDGRPNRRNLIDLPDEPAHHGADAPLVDVLVELHHAKVFLVPLEDGLERPGRIGEADREDAGHARIEGARLARLRETETVPAPRAHLVRSRACRLVHDRHAEPNPFLDRPVLGSRSVLRVGHLVEDDEVAHPPTRTAIFAMTSSGVRSRESITRSKIRVSPTSIP